MSMDAPATPTIRFNRLLPYWAVLQTDLRQTLRSWVFRLWVILSLIAAAGYGLYKVGIHREAGIVQSASMQTGDLMRGVAAASLALIALLAVSAVSMERTTVADAVLSRGISRHQYFLAKWHSRSLVVVVTLALMSVGVLTGYHYLLDPDVTVRGGVAATAIAAAVLAAVVAWGVTVGALASGTVIGITLFWLVLYGVIVVCSFLPDPFPSPTFVIAKMRTVLRGHFDEMEVLRVAGGFLALGLVGAVIGLVGFARKDV
jgi:ABC-2 type transport system permease protein